MSRLNKKPGSIVLIMVMFFIMISAVFYSLLRTNTYCISIAKEREKYEYHYQLARSLEAFITNYYANEIADKSIQTKKQDIFCAPWPYQSSPYTGYAWIERKKRANSIIVTVHSQIKLNNTVVSSLKT